MPHEARVALVALAIFLLNLPFGWWRSGLRKLSAMWFVAIHAPIPFAILLRHLLGVPLRWPLVPLFVGAYFAGQSLGARLRRG